MKLHPRFPRAARLGLLPLALLTLHTAHAASATWNLNPTTGDWNTAENWSPATIPNGPTDVATFGVSNQTNLSTSALTEVDSIIFLPGASAFTITSENPLIINGAGIINNSGITQNLQSQAGIGILQLGGSAVVGDQVRFTPLPGYGEGLDVGSSASASDSEIVNSGSTRASQPGGWTIFSEHSTAGRAMITNGAAVANGNVFNGGLTWFKGSSSAGEAVITCEGAITTGHDGGHLEFFESAQAGNAILIATAGNHGGEGGSISFNDDSDGGTAQVQLLGNSILSISGLHEDNSLTIGSLSGEGSVLLGKRQLIIGSNNLSTTFSGIIQDNSSIAKIGTGTLTLSGANTYSHGTTISVGTLLASNTSGSGTGTGLVSVNAGTLGGSGIIAGAVTVGTNTGVPAFLAPSKGAKKPATLTIQGTLTLNDDSTYIYKLDTKRVQADEVIANGVTIDSGAKFSLRPSGTNALTPGQVFTVISNTAVTPIAGTFHNLRDGAIVTVNGNNLQAS